MTTFTIEIKGASLKKAPPNVRPELQRILTKYTLLLQRDIAMNTPVDTGILSAGIHPIVQDLVGSVTPRGKGKTYAPFVEFGTRRMKGAHMFENGINNVDIDAMMEEISAAIGAAWAD